MAIYRERVPCRSTHAPTGDPLCSPPYHLPVESSQLKRSAVSPSQVMCIRTHAPTGLAPDRRPQHPRQLQPDCEAEDARPQDWSPTLSAGMAAPQLHENSRALLDAEADVLHRDGRCVQALQSSLTALQTQRRQSPQRSALLATGIGFL